MSSPQEELVAGLFHAHRKMARRRDSDDERRIRRILDAIYAASAARAAEAERLRRLERLADEDEYRQMTEDG